MKKFVLPQGYIFILPRTYLSYSAMTCWRTSQSRFRREYFENGRKLQTKYLTFGKGIAKAIEDGSYKQILPNLEVLGQSEFEIRTTVRDVPILSFIDDYAHEIHFFQEFKTGKIPWTMPKVQKHEQLVYYATALKWSKGTIPIGCNLVWLETKDKQEAVSQSEEDMFWAEVEKTISLTGKIVVFRRDFDEREITRMEDLIVQTAYEISEAYKNFISEI